MAFAGAGKARHKSWTMTVDEPGSRGCTCKAERDRVTRLQVPSLFKWSLAVSTWSVPQEVRAEGPLALQQPGHELQRVLLLGGPQAAFTTTLCILYKGGGGGVNQSVMSENTRGNLEAEAPNPGWPGQMALITAACPLGHACQELVELGAAASKGSSSLNSQHTGPENTQVAHSWLTYPSLQPSFA